jgi:hypothetical protein
MSEIASLPAWIPKTVTMRNEPLVEEGSMDVIPMTSVFRENHPSLPVFSRELALSIEVQELCRGIFRTIMMNFEEIILKNCTFFKGKGGAIPVDVSHSLKATASRLIGELEARKKPRLKKVNQLVQSKIDCLNLALESLIPFFDQAAVFSSETTLGDMNGWVRRCIKEIYRIDIGGEVPNPEDFTSMVRGYFDALVFDQERLDRFYKYKSSGFSVVETPRVGDTVWYSGGAQFLQGIVTEEGVQTGVGSRKKKRVHPLFELEPKYGREAIFLRRNVNGNSEILSEKKSN